MSIDTALSELERTGVALWADGERLRYRAPAGSVGEETLDWLRTHKSAILERLAQRGAQAVPVADPDNRYAPFPLTDVQGAYLLGRGEAFEDGGVACHAYVESVYRAATAHERFTPERVSAAWRRLVQRHDMLRAVVHADGSQIVLPHVDIGDVPSHEGGDDPSATIARVRARLEYRRDPADRWPLVRVELTRLPDRVVLHWSVDLLAIDHTGLRMLMTEFEDEVLGGSTPRTAPEPTFRDLVAHRRARERSAEGEVDRRYWEQRFADAPGPPSLPKVDWATDHTDQARPFERYACRLGASERSRLDTHAARHSVTSTTALLTAYAHVVERWSADGRFLLNVPTFTRPSAPPGVERVLGDFTAVELLDVDLREPASFAARARTLQARLWDDLAHSAYPAARVLAERARRDGVATPVFPVVFTAALDGRAHDEPRGEVAYAATQTPQVWIDCQVLGDGSGLTISWDVRRGVLPDGVAGDMFAAYEHLVRSLLDEPQHWDRDVEVELPPEQLRRRACANDTGVPAPDGLLHEALLERARSRPDAVAVIDRDGTCTFAQLVARARDIAGALAHRGIGPGDRVAVAMSKSIEQIAAVLGVLVAGAAYVPVDPTHPPARRRAVVDDARCAAVLTDSRLRTAIGDAGAPVLAVDGLPPGRGEPSRAAEPDDPAYVIYTSGTTGRPKGVVISHRSARNTCLDVDSRFAVTETDAVLGLAGLGFDLSVWDIFGVLGAGGRLVLPDPARGADPSAWTEAIERHGVTLWNAVPGQLQMLCDAVDAASAGALRTLRLALLSGDWIPVTLPARARALVRGLEVCSLGGATEAAIWSVSHPIGDVDTDRPSIPYGRPLRAQGVRVLDARGRDVPDWVTGELVITGAGVALGYLGDAERTAARFPVVDGRRAYRTGDLCRWCADGTLEFLGRDDTQVKVRGYRIELAEIEAACLAEPSVGQAVVVTDRERRTLVGVVEPALRADGAVATDEPGPDEFTTGDTVEVQRTAEALTGAAARADRIGLDLMRITLGTTSLGRVGAVSFEHLADELDADETGRLVLRRWLSALEASGDVTDEGGHTYRYIGSHPSEVPETDWRSLADALEASGWGTGPLDMLRLVAGRMPELLSGEVDLRRVLFPSDVGTGEVDASIDVAYRDNAATARLHGVVAETIRRLASRHEGPTPLRVLEVGGGVGGATAALAGVAAEYEIDLEFTDPSASFVERARERHGTVPGMHFARFDPRADLRSQGRRPNGVDVVVVSNALHNWDDTRAVLRRLAELLRPGGRLLVVENVRDDSPALRVTTEFMELRSAPFTDGRSDAGQVFWRREQWPELFASSGFTLQRSVPGPGEPIAAAGQMLFTALAKADRAEVSLDDLDRRVRGRLPGYMVPSRWEVVDLLPRTGNGKIDRAALVADVVERTDRSHGDGRRGTGRAMDAMERQIAEIWAELLEVDHIGADDDFFALGGDSLLVARFVGLLRERVPDVIALQWETVLRHMLERPTVAHLANHLRDVGRSGPLIDDGPIAVRSSPFIALHGSGEDPTTVFVHAGTGTALPYRSLVTELRRRSTGSGTLAALELPDLGRFWESEPEGLIDRLAADDAADLIGRGVRRVHLVGYCLGGLIATEVARNLTESGAEVESLTLISSHSPRFRLDDEVLAEYSFAVMMGIPPEALGFPADENRVAIGTERVLRQTPGVLGAGALAALDGAEADVGEAFAAVGAVEPEERIARMCAHVPATAGMYTPEHLGRLLRTFRQSVFAISRYRPEPYAGDATFLRHSGSYPFPGSKAAVTAQWEEVVLGDLDIVDVPGDHFTCLSRENAPGLVAVLERTTGGAVLR